MENDSFDFEKVHSRAIFNKVIITDSKFVGCFSCLRVYPSAEVNWIHELVAADTALCCYCSMDTVIPIPLVIDNNGYGMTTESAIELLTRMKECFST